MDVHVLPCINVHLPLHYCLIVATLLKLLYDIFASSRSLFCLRSKMLCMLFFFLAFFFSFNNWRPFFLLILFCPPKLLSFTVFLTCYWTIGPYSNQGLNLATLSSSGRLWSTSPAELAALDLKAHLDVPLNCNILHGRQDCIRLPFVFFWLVTFIRIKLSSTREYTGKPATTTQNKENTKTRKAPRSKPQL